MFVLLMKDVSKKTLYHFVMSVFVWEKLPRFYSIHKVQKYSDTGNIQKFAEISTV